MFDRLHSFLWDAALHHWFLAKILCPAHGVWLLRLPYVTCAIGEGYPCAFVRESLIGFPSVQSHLPGRAPLDNWNMVLLVLLLHVFHLATHFWCSGLLLMTFHPGRLLPSIPVTDLLRCYFWLDARCCRWFRYPSRSMIVTECRVSGVTVYLRCACLTPSDTVVRNCIVEAWVTFVAAALVQEQSVSLQWSGVVCGRSRSWWISQMWTHRTYHSQTTLREVPSRFEHSFAQQASRLGLHKRLAFPLGVLLLQAHAGTHHIARLPASCCQKKSRSGPLLRGHC